VNPGKVNLPPLKDAFDVYRTHFKTLLALAVPLVMVMLVTIVLAIVFPFSLIVTFPFLIVPFSFAYIVSITQIVSDHPLALNEYYRFLLPGMNPFIRRLVHPYVTLLKMALLAFISLIVVTSLAMCLAPYFNTELSAAFDEMALLGATSFDANDISDFLTRQGAVLSPFLTSLMAISSLVSFIYLMLSFSNKIPALYLIIELPTAFPELDRIHKQVIAKNRKRLFKLTIKNQWPTLLGITLGFGVGIGLGLIFSLTPLLVTLLSLIGALVGMFLLIPHYFLVLAIMYQTLEADYLANTKDQIRAFLAELDNIEGLSEQQRDDIRRELGKHLSDINELPSDTEEEPKQ